ncbi:MAG: hypothetical protein M1814_000407 [Vezdaea aestivalis]|nr:MAG: hypothetical protein M1814_000407 [Vezdaea aestivalis]
MSDVYDLKEIDNAVYEVDCKMITIGGENVGRRAIAQAYLFVLLTFGLSDIGANPSAEEADEGTDDQKQQVIDIVHSFRLVQTNYDKKQYTSHLKSYMKAVKAKMEASGADEAKVKAFEKNAAGYFKKILPNFKDYDFYTGESMNPDGIVVLVNFREDGITPYATIWKDGLSEMKV